MKVSADRQFACLLATLLGFAATAPVAAQDSPTENAAAPENAIVLFDGSNMDAWASQKNRQWETSDGPADWKIVEGNLQVVPGAGSLITKQRFGDGKLHFEVRTLGEKTNGGVYLMTRYEINISETDQCGAFSNLAEKIKPSVAVTVPAMKWQTFDIEFRAPRFDDKGNVTEKARCTVLRDGVTIHDNVELGDRVGAAKRQGDAADGCIMLQEHGTTYEFRNIWIVNQAKTKEAKLEKAKAVGATSQVDNWHQWRGPFGNGFAPHADPPLQWDESKNVKWKVEIPGSGSSTPIVWGNRIFLVTAIDTGQIPVKPVATTVAAQSKPAGGKKSGRKSPPGQPVLSVPRPETIHRFVVLCLDRSNGNVIWEKTATESVPYDGHHPTHGYASASPTTDGEKLIVSFGSYGIFCFDFDGNLRWSKNLGQMQTRRGFGEAISPVLHDDSLVIKWDHEGQSFLTCLDAQSGDEKWRTQRDEPTTWGTPLVVVHDGVSQVITNATDRSRSYDLATGEEIWQCGGQVMSPIPSPVSANGIAYCMTGYLGFAINAIPLDAKGDITDTELLAWKYTEAAPYVASPLLYDDQLYFTKSQSGILVCLNAHTGELVYEMQRIPGISNVYASPVGAKGKVYFTDRDGTTTVVKQGPKFEVLARNKLAESMIASPAIVGNEIFLRGEKYLYCINEK